MGQMTFAVMLGCPMPKAPDGKAWYGDSEEVAGEWVWKDGIFDIYKAGRGPEPKTEESNAIVGLFIAVGASGEDGCAPLEGPIDLASVETVKAFAKPLKRARAAWVKFSAFCAGQGAPLTDPRFYLVEVEVA